MIITTDKSRGNHSTNGLITGKVYRRFVARVLIYILILVSFHFITWKCITEILLTDKYDGGDLSRMGYILGSKHYRKTHVDLPMRHIEMEEYRGQPVDLLTIGDSFSLGGGRGRNPYYQDFIASINGFSVLNVFPYPTSDLLMGCSPMSTLAVLYNSGYLDKIRPRYVLLESLESLVPPRFNRRFDFTWNDKLSKVVSYYENVNSYWPPLPKVPFINSGNLTFYVRNLQYLHSDNAYGKVVYQRDISRPLFTVRNQTKLLFHRFDIDYIPSMTPSAAANINDNLNRMADLLAKKGIKLVFMPVVCKYNLYSPYIVNNPYPESSFFEKLRPLPKRYTFIDTKALLLEELRKGEKDIFFADDSHWSWKASKKVFETVRFQ